MNILVVEDHPITALGIEIILQKFFINATSTIVGDKTAAFKSLQGQKFDLVIMDIMMPGFDAHAFLFDVLKRYPNSKILVHSSCHEEIYAKKYLQAGAHGYINKSCTNNEFELAVKTVLSGNSFVPKNVSSMFMHDDSINFSQSFTSLSNRELEVFNHLLKGKKIKQICKDLNLEPSTIGTHKARIFKKLKVNNIVELIQLATAHNVQNNQ